MPRRFNTAGPSDPARHYMIPPLRRLGEAEELIDNGAYFTVHAPRQSGKTTTFLSLARALTEQGRYTAAHLSMITASAFGDDLCAAEDAILTDWCAAAEWQLPEELRPPVFPMVPPGQAIAAALKAWAEASPRPLVLFIDEIDSIHAPLFTSILAQLKSHHPARPAHFPWSIALIGMRELRGTLTLAKGERVDVAALFNIHEASLSLPDFSIDEVRALYEQHTEDTGQGFEPSLIEAVHQLSAGEPWIVNALARQMTDEQVKDRALPISLAELDKAREALFARRDSHLDNLMERLSDARVQKVIEPLLTGDLPVDLIEEERAFVLDIGLVRRAKTGRLEIANPFYAQMLVRRLTQPIDDALVEIVPVADGKIEPMRLLESFIELLRQHGEELLAAAPYPRAAHHLLLLAFLARQGSSGAAIQIDCAMGKGYLRILLEQNGRKLAIVAKVRRKGQGDPLEQGLEMLERELEALGLSKGWLVIFDQRRKVERLNKRASAAQVETPKGNKVVVVHA